MRGVHVAQCPGHTKLHALDGDGPYSLGLSLLWFRAGQTSTLQSCSGAAAQGVHCTGDTWAGATMARLPQCPLGLYLMAQNNPQTD